MLVQEIGHPARGRQSRSNLELWALAVAIHALATGSPCCERCFPSCSPGCQVQAKRPNVGIVTRVALVAGPCRLSLPTRP